jgi:2-iminobutanoate/2-iminopropanoate deaminase
MQSRKARMKPRKAMNGPWLALIGLAIAGLALAADPSMRRARSEYYPVTGLPAAMHLPFSEAVRVGDMLYLSGMIGTNKSGTLVPGGMAAEAAQAMDNIGATLRRHGSSFDRVVQCTVALADIKDWPAFNDVYRRYFSDHFPARMAYATAGLALGARVEVQCNATVGASTRRAAH